MCSNIRAFPPRPAPPLGAMNGAQGQEQEREQGQEQEQEQEQEQYLRRKRMHDYLGCWWAPMQRFPQR